MPGSLRADQDLCILFCHSLTSTIDCPPSFNLITSPSLGFQHLWQACLALPHERTFYMKMGGSAQTLHINRCSRGSGKDGQYIRVS